MMLDALGSGAPRLPTVWYVSSIRPPLTCEGVEAAGAKARLSGRSGCLSAGWEGRYLGDQWSAADSEAALGRDEACGEPLAGEGTRPLPRLDGERIDKPAAVYFHFSTSPSNAV